MRVDNKVKDVTLYLSSGSIHELPQFSSGTAVLPVSSSIRPNIKPVSIQTIVPKITAIPLSSTCSIDISPSHSDGSLVSMDESMSTFDTVRSPEVEYIDDHELTARVVLVPAADICKGDALVDLESGANIVNIDNNLIDPQLCATMACDIYKHLRASEANKRHSTDFMAKVHKDINPGMRAILFN
ncbi:hypothetical protein RDI58_020084 [Solanum bulbocastanum]|uniref:Uncharacterized protein n=1 Tax=Solanum bulbocastanum TaxID=147425 RepID=A0AAN8TCY6_SOLBU